MAFEGRPVQDVSVRTSWPPRDHPLASVRASHSDLCSIKITWRVTPLRSGADGCNRYPPWKFLHSSERPLVLFWTLSSNMLNDTGFQRDGQLQWRQWQDILSPGWPGLHVCASIILADGERKNGVDVEPVHQFCLPEAVAGLWIRQIPQSFQFSWPFHPTLVQKTMAHKHTAWLRQLRFI